MTFFNDRKEGGNFHPLFKTPDEVRRENTTRPDKEFETILKKVDTLGETLESVLSKPDTQQNKIEAMRIYILLAYELERLPKMNKDNMVKFSEAVKESKKATYNKLRKIIAEVFGLKLIT